MNSARRVVTVLVLLFVVVLIARWAEAATPTIVERNSAVAREFKRLHPCPKRDESTGACLFVADHKKSLCGYGKDTVTNMQWQTLTESLLKDREEKALCRMLRDAEKSAAGDNAAYCRLLKQQKFPRLYASSCPASLR